MTLLGVGLEAAVPGAPYSGTVGSAAHRPLPRGQAALIQGQVPAEDPSPPVLPCFPLPTVTNKAPTSSLQDPTGKITSSCSTLSHHGWGTALWAHAHRWGGNWHPVVTLPMLKPCGMCCHGIDTLYCPPPSPAYKEMKPLSKLHSLCACR